jgi:hypothetical protein
MPRLENWYVNNSDCIVGQVYGDPRFEDGTLVITSRVATLDSDANVAVTKNSNYILGTRRDDAPEGGAA